jgi:hypothetical protein
MAYLVLDLGVAPRWGHILRHDGGNGLFWGSWMQNEESPEKLVTCGHVVLYSNVG